jgi:hypothetical protein
VVALTFVFEPKLKSTRIMKESPPADARREFSRGL